ncbi:MAG: 4-hydroxythreonine-4-phosphate dehydrogenase PdxA [Kiritimatiellae bacterium]|jgi:4-hydroxythreonine-4-phosphate dehydrogenase|nr:4-hydroxythreonine-4-phosphate dehydrogenase PdxA [Kiritimatiellia bacterium]
MSCIKPRIALTTGDSAGIGPELVLHALNSPEIHKITDLVVYGSKSLLQQVSKECGIPFPSKIYTLQSLRDETNPLTGNLLINIEFDEQETIQPGMVQAACGAMAARWITDATRDVLEHRTDALVTAPINKKSLNLARIHYSGHTDMLASLCGTKNPCMTFFTPGLIIALATIHIAIADVPKALNAAHLKHIAKLIHQACLQQGITNPKLGILALNPHGGEGGLFGDEESRIILPAIQEIRKEGIDISDPLVPDTAFTWLYPPRKKAPYNAYIAMYHDQALIPFKMAAFDKGVNVTLGLPIIRTSPDHGTAFDLAWQGKATPTSLFEAIKLAAKMSGTPHNIKARSFPCGGQEESPDAVLYRDQKEQIPDTPSVARH